MTVETTTCQHINVVVAEAYKASYFSYLSILVIERTFDNPAFSAEPRNLNFCVRGTPVQGSALKTKEKVKNSKGSAQDQTGEITLSGSDRGKTRLDSTEPHTVVKTSSPTQTDKVTTRWVISEARKEADRPQDAMKAPTRTVRLTDTMPSNTDMPSTPEREW